MPVLITLKAGVLNFLIGENMKVLVSGLINIESNVFVNNFPVEYSPIEYAFNQVSFDFSGVAYNIIKALSALV